MSEIQHSSVCRKKMSIERMRRTRFIGNYPHYCDVCDATGIVGENSCPACLGNILCPRCMTPTLVSKKHLVAHVWTDFLCCKTCNWRSVESSRDTYHLPPLPECICRSRTSGD